MIVDICQQSLAGLCQCQLDVAPILWQIAPVKKSRLDESSADPAGRRQMDVERMRYAGCVQRARLGCQNQDAQWRQGHAFADSCNGLGRNGAEDACRTLKCSKYCAADSPRRTVLRFLYFSCVPPVLLSLPFSAQGRAASEKVGLLQGADIDTAGVRHTKRPSLGPPAAAASFLRALVRPAATQ